MIASMNQHNVSTLHTYIDTPAAEALLHPVH